MLLFLFIKETEEDLPCSRGRETPCRKCALKPPAGGGGCRCAFVVAVDGVVVAVVDCSVVVDEARLNLRR